MRLILALGALGFMVGCSGNSNPLAVFGKRCSLKYNPSPLELSKEEVESKSQKLNSKPSISDLPDGNYRFEAAEVYVQELFNGKDDLGEGFRIGFVDSLKTNMFSKDDVVNLKPGLGPIDEKNANSEAHIVKSYCVRNALKDYKLDYSAEAISDFAVVSGQAVDYATLEYRVQLGNGPSDKLTFNVQRSDKLTNDIDAFFRGDNKYARGLQKAIYQVENLKPNAKKPEENVERYQIRSEYKSDNVLIRVNMIYKYESPKLVPPPEAPKN